MNRSLAATFCLLALEFSGCAETPTPTPATATAQPPRRRRRRRQDPDAGVAEVTASAPSTSPGPGGDLALPSPARPTDPSREGPSMGTPIVAGSAERGTLTPRWSADEQRVVCTGTATPLRPSTQSPQEPTSAMIVRAFLPAEHGVVACRPPVTANGRLPLRGQFHGTGLPDEYFFPGVRVTERQAQCLGAALCAVRMPAFRSPSATVQYEVLVAVPE